MHTLSEVQKVIPTLHKVYFYTIKPPSDIAQILFDSRAEQYTDYFRKKSMPAFQASCKSEKGFRHYHGIVQINSLDTQKSLKAIQRYINRQGAYLKIDPIQNSIASAYSYIMDEKRNQPSKTSLSDPL